MECYSLVTCLLLKHSRRKSKWYSTHGLFYRYRDWKQSDCVICSFVVISFHELICAMKTKGQWPWTGTPQSALIMKHWIMKRIIKTNKLQRGTWFLELIFREMSSPRETYSQAFASQRFCHLLLVSAPFMHSFWLHKLLGFKNHSKYTDGFEWRESMT